MKQNRFNFKKILLERLKELIRNFSFPSKKALAELVELAEESYATIDANYFKKIIEKIIMDERSKGKKANLELVGKFSKLYEIFKNPKEWQF